ncbi:MAG: GspH/FimT family pseudopilin [Desulfamplus sp.]|nr:GspH/FimT family pseudopilin [Desulfamplus sp.]
MSIKSRNSAFTLTEVMVVIAIVSVLASIAIPNIIEWLPEQRLKSAARDVVSIMQEAKLEAIKQNRTITLFFNTSVSPGYYFFDTDNDNTYDAGEKRIMIADYKSGINFGSGAAANNWSGISVPSNGVSFGGNRCSFTSRGFSNTLGTVYLENKNNDICFAITVTATGLINLRKYNGAAWEN